MTKGIGDNISSLCSRGGRGQTLNCVCPLASALEGNWGQGPGREKELGGCPKWRSRERFPCVGPMGKAAPAVYNVLTGQSQTPDV